MLVLKIEFVAHRSPRCSKTSSRSTRLSNHNPNRRHRLRLQLTRSRSLPWRVRLPLPPLLLHRLTPSRYLQMGSIILFRTSDRQDRSGRLTPRGRFPTDGRFIRSHVWSIEGSWETRIGSLYQYRRLLRYWFTRRFVRHFRWTQMGSQRYAFSLSLYFSVPKS